MSLTYFTPTQLRERILGTRRRPCQREVEYRYTGNDGDASDTGDTGTPVTLPIKGPCHCPAFNVTADGRIFCASCESGHINGLTMDDKQVRRAVPLRVILVDAVSAAKMGVVAKAVTQDTGEGVLVEMRPWLEATEAERQQRREQRRLDAIRAKNIATLAALEQQRLKGF